VVCIVYYGIDRRYTIGTSYGKSFLTLNTEPDDDNSHRCNSTDVRRRSSLLFPSVRDAPSLQN